MILTNITAIIILNYNNWQDTINCVESVEKHNSANIKYVIVDNGSTNSESVVKIDEYLSRAFAGAYMRIDDDGTTPAALKKCTFLVSKTNDGYAQGNNKGLKLAFADDEISHVLILNNDILFVDDIIPALTTSLEELPNAAIVSPCLFKADLHTVDYTCARRNYTNWELILTYLFMYKDFFGILSSKERKRFMLKSNPALCNQAYLEIELPSGSCMMMRKEQMRQIGGFDPHTFLFYEENILFAKTKAIDRKNYLLPKLRCIHLGASSTSKSSSAFILGTECSSAKYYLKHYASLTTMQRIVLPLATGMMRLKIRLIKLLKG